MSSDKLRDVKQWLEGTVKMIVDHPGEVEIKVNGGTHSAVLEVHTHKDDVRKVIGKRGVHADAIRKLLTARGGKDKMRYILEIVEEER